MFGRDLLVKNWLEKSSGCEPRGPHVYLDAPFESQGLAKLSRYRVLICGVLSPLAALVSYVLVYSTLKRISSDLERDWLLRLSLSTAAMTLPFLATLFLAMKESRRHTLSLSAKIGFVIALLSLGLVASPIADGLTRWKQSRNMAMHDVDAPTFDTVDINGNIQRLQDQKGKVVLVNIWATWCVPCRTEMPKLERLYQLHKDQGFIVFGLTDEDVNLQRKYIQQVAVSYPLLTVRGQVPAFYRDIARYPTVFLIDRRGQLQPAPGPDEPFDRLEAAVVSLLRRNTF